LGSKPCLHRPIGVWRRHDAPIFVGEAEPAADALELNAVRLLFDLVVFPLFAFSVAEHPDEALVQRRVARALGLADARDARKGKELRRLLAVVFDAVL